MHSVWQEGIMNPRSNFYTLTILMKTKNKRDDDSRTSVNPESNQDVNPGTC